MITNMKILVIINLILILLVNQRGIAQKIGNAPSWEKRFENSWNREYLKAKAQSVSGDSRKFYDLSYSIDANTTMYVLTKDIKYIKRGIEYVNDMISTSIQSKKLPQSSFKDDFFSWACKSGPNVNKYGDEVPLYESYCWRYVTTMLRIIKSDSALYRKESILNEYNKILNFTEQNVYLKWLTRGKSNLYRSNTHMISHWARICADLFIITGKEEYMLFLKDFIELMEQKMEFFKINGIEYVKWKLNIHKNDAEYQDVSHGNAVVGTIIEIYENKQGFDRRTIIALKNTLNDIIWKSRNRFSFYVDGTGKGSGWLSDGFVKLGRYDENLQRRLLGHDRGRSTQFLANLELNRRILEERKSNK